MFGSDDIFLPCNVAQSNVRSSLVAQGLEGEGENSKLPSSGRSVERTVMRVVKRLSLFSCFDVFLEFDGELIFSLSYSNLSNRRIKSSCFGLGLFSYVKKCGPKKKLLPYFALTVSVSFHVARQPKRHDIIVLAYQWLLCEVDEQIRSVDSIWRQQL